MPNSSREVASFSTGVVFFCSAKPFRFAGLPAAGPFRQCGFTGGLSEMVHDPSNAHF
jgi:hypothetical protein